MQGMVGKATLIDHCIYACAYVYTVINMPIFIV